MPEPNDLSALNAAWTIHSANTNIADAVYATLREGVISGSLPAGYTLTEEQIARYFNISRTPVREALMKLEAENLATRISRRGLVVRKISEREVLDIYTVRTVLDSLAARLAALEALPSERTHLRWINEQLADATKRGDSHSMSKWSSEFHLSMAQASHNTILLEFSRRIHDLLCVFGETTFSYTNRSSIALNEHEMILKAIDMNDPDMAEKFARDHIHNEHMIRMKMLKRCNSST